MNKAIYGAFSKIYDRLMEDFDYQLWFQTMETMVERNGITPRTCLEIGCGTGNLSAHLAKAYELTAIDQSQAMLDVAKSRGIAAQWYQGDVLNLALNQRFDLIVLSVDVLHYIQPERRRDLFATLSRLLEEDGLLVWDTRDRTAMEELDGSLYPVDEEDLFAIYAYDMVSPQQLTISVQAFYREDEQWQRIRETHELYLMDVEENMWKSAGLVPVGEDMCYPRLGEVMEADRRTLTMVKKGTR